MPAKYVQIVTMFKKMFNFTAVLGSLTITCNNEKRRIYFLKAKWTKFTILVLWYVSVQVVL